LFLAGTKASGLGGLLLMTLSYLASARSPIENAGPQKMANDPEWARTKALSRRRLRETLQAKIQQ